MQGAELARSHSVVRHYYVFIIITGVMVYFLAGPVSSALRPPYYSGYHEDPLADMVEWSMWFAGLALVLAGAKIGGILNTRLLLIALAGVAVIALVVFAILYFDPTFRTWFDHTVLKLELITPFVRH